MSYAHALLETNTGAHAHNSRREELHAHSSHPRKVSDFKHSQRDKKDNAGKMFTKIYLGQEVPDNPEIMKFSVITITHPDLPGKNQDIIDEIARLCPELAGVGRNTQDFEGNGHLLAGADKFLDSITENDFRIMLLSMFKAVENVVIANKNMLSEEELDDFLLKNADRIMRIENFVMDGQQIFSNPTHGGAVAYRNNKTFGQEQFRMEWIYSRLTGTIMTPGTPDQNYAMSVMHEGIASGVADKALIRFLDGYISGVSTGPWKSMAAIESNSTDTISECAGNVAYNNAANNQIQNSNVQVSFVPTDSSTFLGDSVQAAIQATTGNNSLATSPSGFGGDIGNVDTNTKAMCSKCGKINDKNVPMCSCAIKGPRRDAEEPPIQTQNHYIHFNQK